FNILKLPISISEHTYIVLQNNNFLCQHKNTLTAYIVCDVGLLVAMPIIYLDDIVASVAGNDIIITQAHRDSDGHEKSRNDLAKAGSDNYKTHSHIFYIAMWNTN